jgi:hypothetical protein
MVLKLQVFGTPVFVKANRFHCILRSIDRDGHSGRSVLGSAAARLKMHAAFAEIVLRAVAVASRNATQLHDGVGREPDTLVSGDTIVQQTLRRGGASIGAW